MKYSRIVAKAVDAVLVLLLSGSILLFLGIVIIRLQYPYELEWLEGASVDQSRWILGGHPLYGPPSIEFVPLPYSPIFFYASAALMKFIGVGFVAPRLISILSTLISLALLFLIVEAATANKLAGLVAAGLYAATYHLVGTWMDLGRPDSLYLLFLLAGLYLSQRYPLPYSLVASGALYAMAYHTKQPALLAVGLMLIASPIVFRRKALYQVCSCIAVAVGMFLLWNVASQGWFAFYTFRKATSFEATKIWLFWEKITPELLPILFLCGAFLLVKGRQVLLAPLENRVKWLPVLFALGLIVTSWQVYLYQGTYLNSLMPATVGLGLLGGLGVDWVQSESGRIYDYARVTVAALLIGQIVGLYYSPREVLPKEENRKASDKLVSLIQAFQGEVLVFDHGYISALAGGKTYLHRVAYDDAAGYSTPPAKLENNRVRQEMVRSVLRQAVRDQVFEAVIVDELNVNWPPYYLNATALLGLDASYSPEPLVGPSARPMSLMLRNPVARGGDLSMDDSKVGLLLGEGWSVAEDGGQWGLAPQSIMHLSLEPGHGYQIKFQVIPRCLGETPKQEVSIRWNGAMLTQFRFSACESQPIQVAIPAELVSGQLDTIQFEYKRTDAPTQESQDTRPLSVRFISANVKQFDSASVSD